MESHDIAIPTVPSRSVSATVAFYTSLRFSGGAPAHDAGCAILVSGNVELHVVRHADLVTAESSAGCYIRLLDVDWAGHRFRGTLNARPLTEPRWPQHC